MIIENSENKRIIKMKQIYQKHKNTCSIASIAMLLGKNYYEVYRKFRRFIKETGRKTLLHKMGMHNLEEEEFIKWLGFDYLEEQYGLNEPIKESCIVVIYSEKRISKSGEIIYSTNKKLKEHRICYHSIVWDNQEKIYLDPQPLVQNQPYADREKYYNKNIFSKVYIRPLTEEKSEL